MFISDPEACREETKVRSTPWRQTNVPQQETLEVATIIISQNAYQHLIQQVRASIDSSALPTLPEIQLRTIFANPTQQSMSSSPLRQPDTLWHLYTNTLPSLYIRVTLRDVL
jgi:hypothetical protein